MNLRMEIVQKHGRKIQQKKKLRKKMKEKKSKKILIKRDKQNLKSENGNTSREC